MKDSLVKLLTSKRFWVALITAIVDYLILKGLPPEIAGTLVTALTSLAFGLMASITGTDIAAARNAAGGRDHKGRRLI